MTEEKSEHIIRQEHYVSGYQQGVEDERARILAIIKEMTNE